MVSLYINNRKVDLGDEGLILMNYTRDEASSPAVVKNSMSQEVTLPGTANNNLVFDSVRRPDRVTGNGLNFLSRIPFLIFDDCNNILEKGYIKVNAVETTEDGIVSYKVNLFGGLGAFFYSLAYNADGTEKTLADIRWIDSDGDTYYPRQTEFPLTASMVKSLWDSLSSGANLLADFVNFAPAYNGTPSDFFDANKAVYKSGGGTASSIPNLYTSKDGYTTDPDGDGTILLNFKQSHNEWEVQDLRAYRQRPIFSISAFLEALQLSSNTGEFTFQLADEDFFRSVWITRTWCTLGLVDRESVNPYTATLADVFKGSASPTSYLLGIAKTFGLVFMVDSATSTITLCTRNYYYGSGVNVDLSKRISRPFSLDPVSSEARHYLWGNDAIVGEFAKKYKDTYGRDYGTQSVNTGYDFDSNAIKALEGVVFKGGADVRESSINFQVFGGNSDSMGAYTNTLLKFALTEGGVSWNLYKVEGGEKKILSCQPTEGWIAPMHYSLGNSFDDFFTKVQLHGEGDKAEDGSNVLLFFEDIIPTPYVAQGSVTILSADFHLSNDTTEMLRLNGGRPCYDVSLSGSNIVDVGVLPQFRRWHYVFDDTHDGMSYSLDFGDPLEVGTEDGFIPNRGIYYNFWRAYVSDKFDKDTKILSCKVDFSGMRVTPELLKNFYFFENSVWVLNAIRNYSIATHDLVDCEFVMVKDMNNYLSGQRIDTPETSSPRFLTADMDITEDAQTKNISIGAESSWFVTPADGISSSAITLSRTTGSGNTTIQATIAQNTGEARNLVVYLKDSSNRIVDSITFRQASGVVDVYGMSVDGQVSINVLSDGVSKTLSIVAPSGKAWTLGNSSYQGSRWFSVNGVAPSEISGVGSATFPLVVDENTTDEDRNVSLLLRDSRSTLVATFLIYQEKAVADTYDITINGSHSYTANSGVVTETIRIDAPSGRAWRLASSSTGTRWFSIDGENPSDVTGVGSTYVTLLLDANPNTQPRSVDIMLLDAQGGMREAVTITQEAKAETIAELKVNGSGTAVVGSFGDMLDLSVVVTQGTEWSLHAVHQGSRWFSVNGVNPDTITGTTDMNAQLSVDPNTSSNDRTFTLRLIVDGAVKSSVSVSQEGVVVGDWDINLHGLKAVVFERSEFDDVMDVVAPSGMGWSLFNVWGDEAWLSVDGFDPSEVSGVGSESRQLYGFENNSGEIRETTIYLQDNNGTDQSEVTIYQSGGYGMSIEGGSPLEVDRNGGTFRLVVGMTGSSESFIFATSVMDEQWVYVEGVAPLDYEGVGSSILSVRVAPNTSGSARQMTLALRVGGQLRGNRIYIHQSA